MKKPIALLAALLLIVWAGFFSLNSHAITITASLSSPGGIQKGSVAVISYTITGDQNMTISASVSVSGGGAFAGVTCDQGQVNENRIIVGGSEVTQVTGTISVNVTGYDPISVVLSGDGSSIEDFTSSDIRGEITIQAVGETIPPETTNADEEEARRRSSEEAASSIAASVYESSVQEASSQEEARRQSSLAASRAEEDSRIASEQSANESREAAEEAARNSSIAASASQEEASRSAADYPLVTDEAWISSIDESINSMAAEDSDDESTESEVETEETAEETTTKKETVFVTLKIDKTRFYFLSAEEECSVADKDLEETGLSVNGQLVKAFRKESMEENLYVVAGTFGKKGKIRLYLYDASEQLFFDYEYAENYYRTDEASTESVTAEEAKSETIEVTSETTAEAVTQTASGDTEKKIRSFKDMVDFVKEYPLPAGLIFITGVLLTWILSMIFRGGKGGRNREASGKRLMDADKEEFLSEEKIWGDEIDEADEKRFGKLDSYIDELSDELLDESSGTRKKISSEAAESVGTESSGNGKVSLSETQGSHGTETTVEVIKDIPNNEEEREVLQDFTKDIK